MNIAQILEELAYDMDGEFPREAIEEAMVKRKHLAPHLLEVLKDAITRVDEIIDDDNYQGHLYAMYLLAQFREEKALQVILELMSYPGEIPYAIAGDVLTEDLDRILASVSMGKNVELIKQMIENPSANEYVRAACQSSLVILVGCGLISRKEVVEYFRELFTLYLEKKHSFVWDSLVLSACSLYPDELYGEITKAFEQNLVDSSFISLEDVATILAEDKESHLYNLFHNTELIEDTVTEMEKWMGSYAPK